MAIREFTRAYQTSDGKVFVDKSDAENHETAVRMQQAIKAAWSEAHHDNFGPTRSTDRFQQRFAEELIRVGFALKN